MEKSAISGWGSPFFGMSGHQKNDIMWDYKKEDKNLKVS